MVRRWFVLWLRCFSRCVLCGLSFFVYLAVPHLTVGALAYGGGTILEPRDSRCLRWRIACPPVFLEEFGGSPTWSRDELFVADVTALARGLSGTTWFLLQTLRPVAARVHFDFQRKRFVIVGGPALEFYRLVQARVRRYPLVPCSPVRAFWRGLFSE